MSFDAMNVITREDLDLLLNDLSREYRKQVKKDAPAEIILTGGASILINYGFRDTDVYLDAIIYAPPAMEEAIRQVGGRHHLPEGWLNQGAPAASPSWSPHLARYAAYYRTYSDVLIVRTIRAEYLIAMYLRACRKYTIDFLDVIGILAEQQKLGKPVTMEMIRVAAKNLYGTWDSIPTFSRRYIRNVMKNGDYAEYYNRVTAQGQAIKNIPITFAENQNPADTDPFQAQDMSAAIRQFTVRRASRAAILEQLRHKL